MTKDPEEGRGRGVASRWAQLCSRHFFTGVAGVQLGLAGLGMRLGALCSLNLNASVTRQFGELSFVFNEINFDGMYMLFNHIMVKIGITCDS